MFITVGDEKRRIGRNFGCPRGEVCAEMIRRAEDAIPAIRDKEALLWHLKNPSGYVRSQVVKRLGDICCEEGKKANRYDYEIFARAIFEDESLMVGEGAVKALAKIKTPMAIALLVQALGCDIGQVRAEAEKALDVLMAEEEYAVASGLKAKNWVREAIEGTLEIIDAKLRSRIEFYRESLGHEEDEARE